MPYQRISVEDKHRLVDAHGRGEDYVQLARQMGIKRTTVYAIIRRAQENGGEVARPRGGARPQWMLVTAGAHCSCHRYRRRASWIYVGSDQFRIAPTAAKPCPHLSVNVVHHAAQANWLQWKKLEDAPQQRNSIVVKNARSNFAQWLMQQGMQHELIFIDEAGIHVWAKRARGRARVGERAVRIVGAARGQNLTMTFAVSATNGLLHHDLQEGGMNGQRFNLFLEHLAGQLPPDEMPRVFIFDNAPAHRRAQEAHLPGNFTLRWLPAYSPFLNIVLSNVSHNGKRLWNATSRIYNQLNAQPPAQRMATLAQIAVQNVGIITPENAQAYFRHLQRYLPDCIILNDIIM